MIRWISDFSDFRKVVKRNNPDLTFFYNDNTGTRGCGIYLHGEFVMGVPLGEFPEYTVLMKDGRIYKRGWRTALGMLLKKRCIQPNKEIERLLGRDEVDSWQIQGTNSKKERIAIQQ